MHCITELLPGLLLPCESGEKPVLAVPAPILHSSSISGFLLSNNQMLTEDRDCSVFYVCCSDIKIRVTDSSLQVPSCSNLETLAAIPAIGPYRVFAVYRARLEHNPTTPSLALPSVLALQKHLYKAGTS